MIKKIRDNDAENLEIVIRKHDNSDHSIDRKSALK